MIVLPALAGMVAGCADSRMAATDAGAGASASSGSSTQPKPVTYQTAYGLSSDGPTTDLYTELFRANARKDPAPATAPSATAAQPVTAPTSGTVARPPAAATSGTVAQGQPATAPNIAQAQPAVAEAPPATATVYGMSSDGPTTDLYTELFGRKRPE
jgi:hypothetical protein